MRGLRAIGSAVGVVLLSAAAMADAETPKFASSCIELNQARLNLALFAALERGELEPVRTALTKGADSNCPKPSIDEAERVTVPSPSDVPLNRAGRLGVDPEVFNLL